MHMIMTIVMMVKAHGLMMMVIMMTRIVEIMIVIVKSYNLFYTDKMVELDFEYSGGVIPSRSTQYMEAACKLNTKLTIHPFAFR